MRPPASEIEPSSAGLFTVTRPAEAEGSCDPVAAIAAPGAAASAVGAVTPPASVWLCAATSVSGVGGGGSGAKKVNQTSTTTMDRTMARIRLRLLSSMRI